jgi:membrane dipeptidase
VTTRADLEAHSRSWESGTGPLGLVVLMEGADAVLEPAELEDWWQRGVRIVAPAWGATRYAGSSSEPGQLTNDGRDLLGRMAEHRMILDVSHLAERATEQALDCYRGSVVASHSNPRALLPSAEEPERHLTDRHIAILAEREGVIGVHLFAKFVADGWQPGRPRPPLAALLDHIDHICQVVGSARHVGIGSDLDGGFGLNSIPAGLDTIADLQLIGLGLAERSYAEEDVAAVLGGNWLALLRRSLP